MTTQNMIERAYSITPTATTIASWDANLNLSANNFIEGYSTTATAATTTTLTVGSSLQQYFTGTTTQTVVLPVTSTLVLGQSFYIVNNSTGIVTVESSGGNTIQAMAGSTTLLVTCILTSGTTAASWNFEYLGAASGGTVSPGTTNELAWYSANGSTVSGLTTADNGILVTSSGGVPSISSTAPAGLTIPTPLISGITSGSQAASGNVGQIVSSVIASGSAISLTNSTQANLTSITLGAGNWRLWGNAYITASAGTNALIGIGTTSATLPDTSLISSYVGTFTVFGSSAPSFVVSITGNTTYYLVVDCAFTGSSTACGGIYAERIS